MTRSRRGFAMLAAACAVIGFSGCGEKSPTPEELFQKAFPAGKELSADMKMELEGGMDMGALFGAEDGDSGMELPMSIVMDVHMNQQGGITHAEGTMSANILGMSADETMDEWQEQHQDGTVDKYSYDADTGTWIVSHDTAPVSDGGLMGLDMGNAINLVLEDTDKKSGVWAVSGELPLDTIGMLSGDGLGEIGLDDIADSMPAVSFLAMFDRSTYEARSIVITMDEYAVEGIKITKCRIAIENIAFGDGSMAVPDNIRSGAVEEQNFGDDELDDAFGVLDNENDNGRSAWIYDVDMSVNGFVGAVAAPQGGSEMQAFLSHDELSGATYLYLMCLNTGNESVAGYLGWQGGTEGNSEYAYVYVPVGRYDVVDFVFYDDLPDAADFWIETFEPWEERAFEGISVTGAWNRADQMVNGTVVNDSGTDIDWVKVKAVFFRQSGEIAYMAMDYADLSQLKDGEDGTFQIWTGMMPQGLESEDLTVSVYVTADKVN